MPYRSEQAARRPAPGSVRARRSVELNREFARDATAEALKFLPDGADEVTDEGFWTELGVRTRGQDRELLGRARMMDDHAFYRDTLEGLPPAPRRGLRSGRHRSARSARPMPPWARAGAGSGRLGGRNLRERNHGRGVAGRVQGIG